MLWCGRAAVVLVLVMEVVERVGVCGVFGLPFLLFSSGPISGLVQAKQPMTAAYQCLPCLPFALPCLLLSFYCSSSSFLPFIMISSLHLSSVA